MLRRFLAHRIGLWISEEEAQWRDILRSFTRFNGKLQVVQNLEAGQELHNLP